MTQPSSSRTTKIPLAKLISLSAWLLSLGLVAFGIWIYLPQRYDPKSAMWFDGLGRQLHPGMTSVFGLQRTPGLHWELIDTAAAILLFSLCAWLFRLAKRLRQSDDH